MNVFEYLVVLQPTKKEAKKGVKPQIILQPDILVEESLDIARMRVARLIPEQYEDRLKDVFIYIRNWMRRESFNQDNYRGSQLTRGTITTSDNYNFCNTNYNDEVSCCFSAADCLSTETVTD